jgi:hypothetical protein
MALTLETVTRNASCNAEVDLVDGGVGAGYVEIRDATTVLATITLHTTAFGAASSGSAVAIGGDDTNPIGAGNPRSATASGTGTADNYRIYDGSDTLLWSGTVTGTGGGGDMELDNTSIASGQTVNLTGLTHTVPAS